jgi:hypothetical protein
MVLQQSVIDHLRHLRGCREIAADIRTRGERLVPCPGQDDTAMVRLLKGVPEPCQLRHHLPWHGVVARLIVDGNNDNVLKVFVYPEFHHCVFS